MISAGDFNVDDIFLSLSCWRGQGGLFVLTVFDSFAEQVWVGIKMVFGVYSIGTRCNVAKER